MQLFIKDEQGKYITATTPEIIKEGRSRTRSTLKKKDFSSNEFYTIFTRGGDIR